MCNGSLSSIMDFFPEPELLMPATPTDVTSPLLPDAQPTHPSDNMEGPSCSSQDGDACEQACWICLDGASPSNPLITPCACPRLCHRSCLSRWQLQQAGKNEETTCRFCTSALPDWRLAHEDLPRADPTMEVVHNGVSHRIKVHPGREGREAFMRRVREILGLGEEEELGFSFSCKLPGAGCSIALEGLEAFDAAVHCASISAGQRAQREREEREQERPCWKLW